MRRRARARSPRSRSAEHSSKTNCGLLGAARIRASYSRDRLIEIAVGLQEANHPQAEIDLPRVDGERALERLDRLGPVAGLLVERAEERQPREVRRVLVLELLHEHRELLVGAVDLRDDLVDLGAQRGLGARRGEGLLEGRQRGGVLVSLRLGASELLERGGERAVVARGRRDDVLELDLRSRELAPAVELAPELAADEEARRLELEKLAVPSLGAVPVLVVEGDLHQRPERLLLVRLHGLERERPLVARARQRGLAALLVQARQREQRRGVVALDGDRALVRGHRVLATVRRPCRGPRGRRAPRTGRARPGPTGPRSPRSAPRCCRRDRGRAAPGAAGETRHPAAKGRRACIAG